MGIVPDWSRTTLLVPAFLFWCPDGLSVIANTAFVKAKLDQMFQRRLEKTCGNWHINIKITSNYKARKLSINWRKVVMQKKIQNLS